MGLIQLHVALENPVHVVNKGTKKLVAQDIMGPLGTGCEMVCISFCGLSTRFTDEQVLLLQSEQNSCFRTRTLLTTFEGASLRSRAPDVVQLTDWPLSRPPYSAQAAMANRG